MIMVSGRNAPLSSVYLVLDTSASMSPTEQELNAALADLVSSARSDPRLADSGYLSVLSFADDADVVLPLRRLADINSLPFVHTGGRTTYGGALRLLRASIEADMQRLTSNSRRVLRPTAFFLTDGPPIDDRQTWLSALERLKERTFRFRPTIVAVGIGEADPEPISIIASSPDLAFSVNSHTPAERAVAAAFELLNDSLRAVSTSVDETRPAAVVAAPKELVPIPTNNSV